MKYYLVLFSFILAVACGSPKSNGTDGGNNLADAGATQTDADTRLVADASTTDASTTDAGTTDAGTTDAEPDADIPLGEAAALLIEDQALDTPFDSLLITIANLATSSTDPAVIRVYQVGGAQDGALLGSHDLNVGDELADVAMTLDARFVGSHACIARLLDGSGQPILGVDGDAVTAEFSVIGDMEEVQLFVGDQMVDGANLYGIKLNHATVPERYALGLWVAFYEDNAGALGSFRGRYRVMPGSEDDVPVNLTTELNKSRVLHAIVREGSASGAWTSGGMIINNLAGQMITSKFIVDSEAFRPVLEVEDQDIVTSTTGTSRLVIKAVTVPEEYIGGAWVAIYEDDAGVAGTFIGNLKYPGGTTRVDQVLSLDTPLAGDNTLHAKLHPGQLWANASSEVMQDSSGNDIALTFQTGARELNYISSPPYTTDDPRHVVVQRAYSFDKPAWVVLARDDNGQPGTILAKKKILKRFAGNVHLYDLYNDFEDSGTAAEYLTGQPGTYRRTVRGQENLHVLLYEDDPVDGQFTYTPGGTEDIPVLDSMGQPVVSRIDVTVAASVQNVQKDSPRYYSPCTISQFITNATALPVDCRCHVDVTSLSFPECKNTIADYLDMEFGSGPRAKTHSFGGYRSGFSEVSSNSLVGLMVWKDYATRWPENDTTLDVGAVIRVDLTTGNRTLVGGRYEDPDTGIIDIGTGPVLSYPFGVQKGPDGMYYVASYGYVRIGASLTPTVDIIKMDPATGNREYVWRSNHLGFNISNQPNPYGHCANGRTETFGYFSVQIGRKSFGMGPDGTFYLTYAHNGNTDTSNGIGILKIGATGDTCGFVTRSKVGINNLLYQGQNVGGGVEPQVGPYNGMLVKDGKLYVSNVLTNELYEVDLATGDRSEMHAYGVDDTNTGSSGTDILWDHHRDLIWQAGLSGATLLYDPATDTSEPLWCAENDRNYKGIACHKNGAWGNNGLPAERGLWLHPTDPDYAFVITGASKIIRVHLPSGTSSFFSY